MGAFSADICGMRKVELSEALFAISVAALAVLSLVYGNFSPLLAPLPWPRAWTFGLGMILVLASAGLFLARTVAAGATIIALCAVAWAIASMPHNIPAALSVGSWYGVSEAVSTLVGVGALYSLRRRADSGPARAALAGGPALRVGRGLFGAACLVYGFAHFAYAAYSLPFVPAWLPARLPLLYLTGACHIAAGVGLTLGLLPWLAAALEAIMIMLFGLLVWLPSFFAHPTPKWAGSTQNQLSETFLNFVLAAVAWMIADSLRGRPRTNKSKG